MTNQTLYEAIFKRKSVRKYDPAPLPDSALAEIDVIAKSGKPLIEGIGSRIFYLGPNEVSMASVKAPHYLCLYSEKKDRYLMNAGFMLQQIDLSLSANGYGSCWIGLGKPAGSPPEANGLDYVIMLAFGKAAEPVYRANTSEFIRKSLPEITQITGADGLLEPVRLAPSASNTQPWFISGSATEIVMCRKKFNPIKAAVYNKFNQIDSGIALCHLWLAIENKGKNAAFDFDRMSVPGGYDFMAKVSVK